MARAFAKYSTIGNWTRRHDTRFYFGDQSIRIGQRFGRCVGAFYLQNPGSAQLLTPIRKSEAGPVQAWGPLCYESENLLPQVQRVLDIALVHVGKKHMAAVEELRAKGYVQILNLSYLKKAKDAKGEAVKAWRKIVKERKDKDDVPVRSQATDTRFVVFGWGDKYKKSLGDPLRVANVLQTFVNSKTALYWPQLMDIEEGKTPLPSRIKDIAVDTALLTQLRDFHNRGNPMYPVPQGRTLAANQYCTILGKAISKVLH
jgi:hypothetical protein